MKRKNLKKYTCIAMILLMLGICAGCQKEAAEEKKDVKDVKMEEQTIEKKKTAEKEEEQPITDIDISEYLESWEQLAGILNMQPTEYWQFPDSESYTADGYYLEWVDATFGMKNEGHSGIVLYGIKLGESMEKAKEVLEDNGWAVYSQGEQSCSYCALINDKEYYLELEADDEDKVSFWYLNNFPEGEDMADFFAILENRDDDTPSEKWKQAYTDYILSNEDRYSANYQLLYINDDEIPELLIGYGSIADGADLCTFDGEAVQTVHMYIDGCSYIERENLFCDSGGRMDGYYDRVYCIDDGMIVELHHGEYGAEDNAHVQFDENNMPIYQYFWDDEQVSETEYEQNLLSVFDESKAVFPYGQIYNMSEIAEKIRTM